jgi:hypothetical protein
MVLVEAMPLTMPLTILRRLPTNTLVQYLRGQSRGVISPGAG